MSDTPDRLRWPRRGQFRSRQKGIRVQGPNGTIPTDDLDDADVEALLDRGFIPVDDQGGSDADSDSDESPDDGADDAEDPDDLRRWKEGFSGKYDPDDIDDTVESGPLPFNPDAKSVPEIRDALQDVDDPAAVRALANIEAEQQARSTAEDAFEGRLTELKDDDAGD